VIAVALGGDLAVHARYGRVAQFGLGILAAADEQGFDPFQQVNIAAIRTSDDDELQSHGRPPSAERERIEEKSGISAV